jgi:hypothetical protein
VTRRGRRLALRLSYFGWSEIRLAGFIGFLIGWTAGIAFMLAVCLWT